MTIFSSTDPWHLANRWDPEPYRHWRSGDRGNATPLREASMDWVFDPRQECIPAVPKTATNIILLTYREVYAPEDSAPGEMGWTAGEYITELQLNLKDMLIAYKLDEEEDEGRAMIQHAFKVLNRLAVLDGSAEMEDE